MRPCVQSVKREEVGKLNKMLYDSIAKVTLNAVQRKVTRLDSSAAPCQAAQAVVFDIVREEGLDVMLVRSTRGQIVHYFCVLCAR